MKKLILIIIAALMAAILCGCGTFGVTCSLDDDNNASMEIKMFISKNGLTEDEISSLECSFGELLTYWQDEGFVTTWNYTDTSYSASLRKTVGADSREEAVSNLMEMMAGEFSPFSYVEGGYSSSYFTDIYNITAQVDLSRIIDYEYVATLPQSQRERISEALGSFSGDVTFDFYGNIINHNGSMAYGRTTVKLKLDETAEIYNVMEVETGNRKIYNELKDDIGRLADEKQKYMLFMAAAGAALAVMIVIAAVAIIRHRKKSVDLRNVRKGRRYKK